MAIMTTTRRPKQARQTLFIISSITTVMLLCSTFHGRFLVPAATAFQTSLFSSSSSSSSCKILTANGIQRRMATPKIPNRFGLMALSSSSTSDHQQKEEEEEEQVPEPPLYVREGLFAVNKPLGWSSQQVVGKIRSILEKDAKARGAPDKRSKRRRPWMKVGHGGTLDPLATGVLVVGVGKGTKELQQYLTGSKGYKAGVELGYQTTTLDLDPNGEVVATKPYDHVTKEGVDTVVMENFRGTILQTPPIFSALKKDGKRLYELGRKGKTEEDIEIEAREIQIYKLDVLWNDNDSNNDSGDGEVKKFGLDVRCGGGTYIRSLVRDIAIALDTVGTMTSLERTKQGVFLPEHCLQETEWNPDNIWKAIEESEDLLVDGHDIESPPEK